MTAGIQRASSDVDERIHAIAQTAAAWRDPEYASRAGAVEATLAAPNRFTEEALAFAINQQMSLLTESNLRSWLGERETTRPMQVGVLNAGNVPLVGLQDFLAVILCGHVYAGSTSSKSPVLLPAFAAEVSARCADIRCMFAEAETLFERSDAIIATGSDETRDWARRHCTAHGIPAYRQLLRGHRFAVAVLDGEESDDELEQLAEDALLHEGFGCRNVAVIWAPAGLDPDPLLDAFARFRAVFPAHESTPSRLKMQQAFLDAVGASHAHGEGLEFLVSKGEAEPQQPGHVRWTEYKDLSDVDRWLAENEPRLQLAVMRVALSRKIRTDVPVEPFGNAQRPPLSWQPDGVDTLDFLLRLDGR